MDYGDITLNKREYRLIAEGEYGDMTAEEVLALKRRFLAAGGVFPDDWDDE